MVVSPPLPGNLFCEAFVILALLLFEVSLSCILYTSLPRRDSWFKLDVCNPGAFSLGSPDVVANEDGREPRVDP